MAGQEATYPKRPGCQAIRRHSACRQHREATRLVRKKDPTWPTRWVQRRATDATMVSSSATIQPLARFIDTRCSPSEWGSRTSPGQRWLQKIPP